MTTHKPSVPGQDPWDFTADLNTAVGTTDHIVVDGYRGGSYRVPNGSSITSVTWNAAASGDDTPVGLNDAGVGGAGTAQAQTVGADEVRQIPAAVFDCKEVAPVVDAAGSIEVHLRT